MSGSVNKVILVGNLGRDPEVKSTQSGGKICNLSIATSESWKDKNSGERKERTEWHRVVIYNDALSGVAERYLRKGSKVYIEGQLETRKWTDQIGQEKYSTEVVLRQYRGELTILDGKNEQPSDGDDSYQSTNYNSGGHQSTNYSKGTSKGKQQTHKTVTHDLIDDDIPF